MSLQRELNTYWQLIRTLLLPMRWLRWSVLGALLVALLGGLYWWLNETIGLGLVMAAFLYGVLFFSVGGLLMPGQMLAMASSKQLSLMGDLRTRLWWLLLGFALVASLFLALLGTLKTDLSFGSTYIAILILVSLILAAVLLVGAYWPGLQGFVFVFAWAYLQALDWLMAQNPLLLAGILLVCWWLLRVWWLHWRPARYVKNFMTQGQSSWWGINGDDKPEWTNAVIYQPKAGAKTWLGSSLRGQADGVKADMQRLVIGVAIGLFFGVLGFWGAGQEAWLKIWQVLGPMLLLIMTLSVGVAINFIMYRRIHCLWLFFPGDRRALYHYVHKAYWRQLLPLAVFLVVVIGLIDSMVGINRSWVVPAIMLVLGLLVAVQMFYLSMLVYRLSGASKRWLDWTTGIFLVVWTLTVIMSGFFIVHQEAHYQELIPLVGVALVINAVFALILPRIWSSVSLVRSQ